MRVMLPLYAERGWSQPYGFTAEPQLEQPLSQPAKQQPLALFPEQQPFSRSAEQQPVPIWYAMHSSLSSCRDQSCRPKPFSGRANLHVLTHFAQCL